jgi:hypothetical protein
LTCTTEDGPGQQHEQADAVLPLQFDARQLKGLLALADLNGFRVGRGLENSAGRPRFPPHKLLVAGQQAPRHMVRGRHFHADDVAAVEREADRNDPVLPGDIKAALVADPDHRQARVGHVVAFAPDHQLGDALDIGARAEGIVVMDPVMRHPARPRNPPGPQDSQHVEDRADHPDEGCDQGDEHWQQVHGSGFPARNRRAILSTLSMAQAANH